MSALAAQPMGCSGVQERRELWERKRSRAARELVRTEQRYCHLLELLTTYFENLLKAKGTIKKDKRESIFSSLAAIQSANQTLLVSLENGLLGPGFQQFEPELHHYRTYVDNVHHAAAVLQVELKKNKAFRRFKKLQESRTELNGLKLEELLQLPVDRIRQYDHFLQDLTSNTSPQLPDFQHLSSAAAAVRDVSQRIHRNERNHQNQLQLLRIQRLLKGRRAKDLVRGRWFLHQGVLQVVPADGTKRKSRMFFLFSDLLLQTRSCGGLFTAPPPEEGSSRRLVAQQAFPLLGCRVEKVLGHTRSQGGLLSLTFPRAKLLLMSSHQGELNHWHQSLCTAVSKHKSETMIHQRENLDPEPLQLASVHHSSSSSTDQNCSSSSTDQNWSSGLRKRRNLVNAGTSDQLQQVQGPSDEWESSAPKRTKTSEVAEQRTETSSTSSSSSSCVIL